MKKIENIGINKAIAMGLLSALIWGATPSIAAETSIPEPISQHKKWTVFVQTEKGKETCFAVTQPSESLPKGVKRGEIFLHVTHFQDDKTINAVSISMGYPLKDNSTPTATIGKRTYSFFAKGETAWPTEDKVQKALVVAMKRGATVVIKGESKRGTKTTDTYSLSGITAAVGAAKKRCGL